MLARHEPEPETFLSSDVLMHFLGQTRTPAQQQPVNQVPQPERKVP